jgi:hypothetical protein
MDHAPNSDTFRRHYLNRHVCADLWAIHRDRNPQKALLRQATSHGGSRDSRRSFTLSGDQIKSIKKDRQYQHLCVAKALSLGRTHKSFYELCREYCSPHSLARHFVQIHMKNLPQEHKFKCPTCSTILVGMEHLRSHADRIHGIDTDLRIDGKQQ